MESTPPAPEKNMITNKSKRPGTQSTKEITKTRKVDQTDTNTLFDYNLRHQELKSAITQKLCVISSLLIKAEREEDKEAIMKKIAQTKWKIREACYALNNATQELGTHEYFPTSKLNSK
jgi:hypothetical protein